MNPCVLIMHGLRGKIFFFAGIYSHPKIWLNARQGLPKKCKNASLARLNPERLEWDSGGFVDKEVGTIRSSLLFTKACIKRMQ